MTFEEAVRAHRAGDLAAAEAAYQAFLPSRNAAHNLASLYAETGRWGQAEHLLRLILAAFPEDAPAAHSLGMTLLAQGRYAEGWALYEARRRTPQSNTPDPPSIWPDLPPEWDGGDLSGKRLLVIAEQGFGDILMFARYFARLRARGVEPVPLLPQELLRLFPEGHLARRALPAADAWTLICSLPYRLGETAIPPPAAPPHRPAARTMGVGVMTSGRPTHVNDRNRSLDPAAAQALLALGRDLSPAATGARDFRDTADIVAGLDLVVTVDTAVAHLAGSLGKPVWILVPAVGVDWRWGAARTTSPWYPSARLFRQSEPGDWAGVLADVRAALAHR